MTADQAEFPANVFNPNDSSGSIWNYENNLVKELRRDQRTINYPLEIKLLNEKLTGIKPFEDNRGNLWFGDLTGVYILKDGGIEKLTEQNGIPKNTPLRPFTKDAKGAM